MDSEGTRKGVVRRITIRKRFKGFVPEGFKYCPQCRQILPISEFYVSRKRYDGLESMCKECKKTYSEYRYKKHSEEVKEQRRKMGNMNSYARNLIGQVAERVARGRLKRKGFSVQKFNHCNSPLCLECGLLRATKPDVIVKTGYPRECKRGKKWLKLMKYRDRLQKTRTSNKGITLDYYAKKDGEEYVIEVKANTSRLSKAQKELISYAKELGYNALYIHVTIDVTGKIDEIIEK